ncbi:hypothetical protein [Streptomyces sp. NPDC005125]
MTITVVRRQIEDRVPVPSATTSTPAPRPSSSTHAPTGSLAETGTPNVLPAALLGAGLTLIGGVIAIVMAITGRSRSRSSQ